jgi:hypothetical protein
MFIGDRRTKHSIRAYRAPGEAVVIPKDSVIRDVRTSTEPGCRFPVAMKIVAWQNPSLHVFEYRRETLYVHFAHRLMDATTKVTPSK